jgi:hypothetical protein
MRRTLYVSLLSAGLSLSAFAQQKSDAPLAPLSAPKGEKKAAKKEAAAATNTPGGGYLKAKWGSSEQEVRRLYPQAKPLEEGRGIKINQDIAGKPAVVSFEFHSGKLYRAVVLFTEANLKEGNLVTTCDIDDYVETKQLLGKKYGAPASDEILWKEGTEPKPEAKWQRSIGMGNLRLGAQWSTGDTGIALGCNQNGLSIRYESLTLREEVAGAEEQTKLRDL